MTATTIRPLAASEKGFALDRVYIGYSVRTRGVLDLAAMAVAYDALRQRYPALTARIEKTDKGFEFVEARDVLQGMVVSARSAESGLEDIDLDQCAALGLLSVRQDGDESVVTLFTHHSITDSATGQDRVELLWSYYTAAVEGEIGTVESLPFPCPVEEILAAHGIHKPPFPEQAAPPAQAATTDRFDGKARYVREAARLRLGAEHTAALTELSHREQVSINGLVSGALLLAEAELRGSAVSDLVYMFPVSLRAHLDPKVSVHEGTVVLGFTGYVASGEVTTIVDLGRAISAQVRAGLADGLIQLSPLLIPEGSEGVMPQIPGLVTATNWGRLPQLRVPAGLEILDFHSTLASTPATAPTAPDQLPTPPNYIISSFDGRLSIEVDRPGASVEDQQQRLNILEKVLRQNIPLL
ncbi:acyltransferase [Nocardia sp. JMUB6875]|uniref:phthiocerol/phthiodiolone dimycocerosyl transferase family protein n=1 Tax=Nocardia sp. JMUB6875 TaxID=3158170 RepID=UPI0032E5D2B9